MRLIGASSSTTRIASGMRPSCRHEREIRFEGREVEPVRRVSLLEEIVGEDAIRLVAVAVPEAPGDTLQATPGDDGQTAGVVANDIDGMPAPRARPRGPGERARPVPDGLPLRRQRELH